MQITQPPLSPSPSRPRRTRGTGQTPRYQPISDSWQGTPQCASAGQSGEKTGLKDKMPNNCLMGFDDHPYLAVETGATSTAQQDAERPARTPDQQLKVVQRSAGVGTVRDLVAPERHRGEPRVFPVSSGRRGVIPRLRQPARAVTFKLRHYPDAGGGLSPLRALRSAADRAANRRAWGRAVGPAGRQAAGPTISSKFDAL